MEPYEAEVFFHCWWSAEDVGKPYSVAPWSGLRKHEALPNFPGNEATASAAPVTIISSAVQVEGVDGSLLVKVGSVETALTSPASAFRLHLHLHQEDEAEDRT